MIVVCPTCKTLMGREGISDEVSYKSCDLCKGDPHEEAPQNGEAPPQTGEDFFTGS